jgi:hypothetical protein
MPRTVTPRRVRLIPVLLLLAALVAGCGGGAGTAAHGPPRLPHYTTLAELGKAMGTAMRLARTAKITISGSTSGGQVAATTTGSGALRYDQAGPSIALTERAQAANSSQPSTLGLIVLPDQAFVNPPASSGFSLPAGKTWLRIDPNATDPAMRRFAQLVRSVRENADPTQSFAQFGDAAAITAVADDNVDGIPTVRYQIHVDTARAAARATDPAAKQALRQAAPVDSTLWLDAANRPVRVLLREPLPGGRGTFTVDARYRDWGRPVDIAPPPAAEVAG